MKRWIVGVALAVVATVGFVREASARSTFLPSYNVNSGCTIYEYKSDGTLKTWPRPAMSVSDCYASAYWWQVNQEPIVWAD